MKKACSSKKSVSKPRASVKGAALGQMKQTATLQSGGKLMECANYKGIIKL